MKGKYLVADVSDANAIQQASKALTAWDPLISLRVLRGTSLYDGVLVSYLTAIGPGPTTLSFRAHRASVAPGDAIVMPPSIRIALDPAADFLSIRHEGLLPEHMRGDFARDQGFEHHPLDVGAASQSICGARREVIPDRDLRYRLQYHFVEIRNATPHAHEDMVELYYILSGAGVVRIGPAADQLTDVPVRTGSVLIVGPGLLHVPSDGLGACIWFLYPEMAHRRRVREQNAL